MPTSMPPSYISVTPASIPPPPYTPYPSIVPSTIFYHPHSTPTVSPGYTALQPPRTIQIQYPIPPPVFIPPSQPQLIFYPASPVLSPPQQFPTIFQTPPPFPPFLPGAVPPWVPRETRYELIRGVLTPIEVFSSPTTPSGRGWNTIHGYDNGPLPPGFESNAGNLSNLVRSLSHVAVSTQGQTEGVSGRAIGNWVESGSEVVEDAPATSMSGELREEESEGSSFVSAAQGSQAASSQPDSVVQSSTAEARSGTSGRITRTEMERNLNEVEGAVRE